MKYLCLAYEEEKKLNALSKVEWEVLRGETLAYLEELRKNGCLIAAEPLQSVRTAATVRVRDGKVSRTDGPFAETKELIAGYTIIQAKSREEAIEWTRRFPNPAVDGKAGEIEVRQLFELDDFEPSEAIERFRDLEASLAKAKA